jgi:hypothetical protein
MWARTQYLPARGDPEASEVDPQRAGAIEALASPRVDEKSSRQR